MSEMKHTPGPWFASGRYIGTFNHKSAIGECRSASGCWSDDEPASANARLIAAAPELLEALIGVLRVADRATDEFDAARSAIAKATGGQP
ncbi:hypothetical protein [Pseudoxanthomonas jiangsuensis]|uniref:hypothetical protein n=1 Tax=Pseudoxanthomonas jiangsuensis TaxID=619688 RepID=UPI001391B894|nr:hypothetical protein [Pseudoxanthomonas jiangsuensis]